MVFDDYVGGHMSFDTAWNEMHEFKYDNSVVRTQLSFFDKSATEPGFLTPWSETAGFLDAVGELCDNVFKNILLVARTLFVVVTLNVGAFFFEEDDQYAAMDGEDWLACLVALPYYAVSFVADLLVNLTAMVTRTLSTLSVGAMDVVSDCFDSEEDTSRSTLRVFP
jgi:hypothetical protein